MANAEGTKVLVVDEATHKELKLLATKAEMSIKDYVNKLVIDAMGKEK